MIKVAGRPLIDHTIDLLKAAQVPTLVANLHYKPDQLAAHLAPLGVQTVIERNTDAIWIGPNPVQALLEAWDAARMDALLMCVPVAQTRGYTGTGDFARGADGSVSRGDGLVYGGVQIIKTDLLAEIPDRSFRVFGIAPGCDFPQALIDGLRARLAGQPPTAMGRVDLIVNTERMTRRLRQIFDAGPATLVPRIRLVTQLDTLVPGITLPPATTPLRRRLELTKLVSALLDQFPNLAPRASLYALSDSLADLIDEMQGEGVTVEDIETLDVSTASEHWDRTKQFLSIVHTYLAQTESAPDTQARQRARGTTALLMQAVARLPQGAVVLPGFDFDMPTAVWSELDQALLSEDHPQYRFRALMKALELPRAGIAPWHEAPAPSPARNRLVSLSLRPAPVTHAWLTEGPDLRDLQGATQGLTLVEAPSPRAEALAIALRLRQAAEDGQKAALITPDRMLTRQVAAALDRWRILPDDSAGTPLQLSPPGRFLRHVAGLLVHRLDAEVLLTLLKHPLTHSAEGRNDHQLNTQRFELALRREGLPYPDAAGIQRVGDRAARKLQDPAPFLAWVAWVARTASCGAKRRAKRRCRSWTCCATTRPTAGR